MSPTAPPPGVHVGRSVPRRDGHAKVTGAAIYVDDRTIPDCLHGKTIRSTIACGRIRGIEFLSGVPWHEFTVVDSRDIPGRNIVALIENDQPILCEGVVRHREEPVLLIAHPDREMVEKAARHIHIEYEEWPAAFEMAKGKVTKEYLISSGDLDAEMAASDVVFERSYFTGPQEHVYIEPNGFTATWEGDSFVEVRGSLQCPYYVHKAMKMAFGLRDEQINVAQDVTGGGFGGKEEFPSIVAVHAALLARKAGRPVKLIYDRSEDMAASTKRHPSRSRIRTGVMKDGRLRALEFLFEVDGGAYITLTPVVLSRGVLHSFGPYRWPAARIAGKAWSTNCPPYGAFRGFGAPQSIFAMETHMTLLAEHLGIDPAEFRRMNFLRKGDRMPTGQEMLEDPNMHGLLDRALEMSQWREKRAAWRRGEGRGIGISTFMHGAGFTGSGEVYLASKAALETRPDGGVTILVANTDIGQGTETIFPQIAAEVLGIPIELVHFQRPETRLVPNSGPTVASRTTMVVGGLIQKAAKELLARLNGLGIEQHVAQHGPTRIDVGYDQPPHVVWDDKTYTGAAYGTYAWSVNVAEVTVDPVTMGITVDHIDATVDIGTVINPVLAAGQVEGGIAQAVGWATTEVVVLRHGAMANHHMTNYIIPTSADMPETIVEFIPNPYPHGAFGSKGVGELPMDGPAPAIAGAVHHATGREPLRVPITPEELLS